MHGVTHLIWSSPYPTNPKVEALPFLCTTADTSLSGGARMLWRGTQVQADYCDSMCCWIVPGRGRRSTLALVM